MASRKAVLLIVEGENDEDLLDLYLKEKFPRGKNETYQFEVTKGDVLSNPRKQQTSAKKLVGEILEGFMKKSKFRPSDIVHIFHIIDIDGIMASSDDIVIDESLENNHEYDLVNNKVKFKKLSLYEKTKGIWDKKKEHIKVLSRTTEISKKKYDLLFFSLTSEHVISGKVAMTQDDKDDVIDNFQSKYPDVDSLMTFLENDDLFYPTNSITESWQQFLDEKGIVRKTNINLLFKEIDKYLYTPKSS